MLLEPDRDQIEVFVQALFRYAAPQGFVSLRSFFECQEKPFRITATSLSGGLGFLIDVAEDDARRAAQAPKGVVFAPPIATFLNKTHAREQDIAQGLALTTECDHHPQEARERLEHILGPATAVIRSGGKWTNGSGVAEPKLHLHWRLKIPAVDREALLKLKHARDIAARVVGGDPTGKSIVHPFRWPGSWHRKAKPILCRIDSINPDREIDLDAAYQALLAIAPTEQNNNHAGTPDAVNASIEWVELISGIITGKSYHPAIIPLSAKLITAGLNRGATVNLLRALMENSAGPRDERWHSRYNKISADVDSAESKYAPKTSPPITATSLKQMTFDPIKFVVSGIIVEGLTLLAGKPKVGKSWLLLHAAIAVARNGFTLGDIHCPQGDVLYCALEDNLRRLRSRMDKLLGTQEWPERLSFVTEMPRLTEGGLERIKQWIASAKQPRLVIIDTLAMIRSPAKKKDQTQYDADYGAIMDLRDFAHQHGVAIVLVHHLRKQDAEDAFDTVSGTLGLTGAPDTILVIKRDQVGTMILHGRGRDIPEIEKAMTFNRDTCVWTISGEAAEARRTKERADILEVLREATDLDKVGSAPIGAREIASAVGMKVANVRRMLSRMATEGSIEKVGFGKYRVAKI